MTTSPNTGNYYVGKGIVKIKIIETGNQSDPPIIDNGVWRDLGNAPLFELTPAVTKLAHYSSRAGRKFKDKQITQQVELSVKLTLDEITPENLALALMGSEADSTGLVHNIMDLGQINCALRFVGTNDVGDMQQVDLPNVLITPTGSIGFISDGWAQLQLDGDVVADVNGNFGTIHSEITAEIP